MATSARMAPIPENEDTSSADLGFTISHQKVDLDLDLFSRSVKGKTELTILPHSIDLRTIKLNCRQSSLTRLTVNGKAVSGVKYDDPYEKITLRWRANVFQYHMLQERLESIIQDEPEEELAITLPKSVKVEELGIRNQTPSGISSAKSNLAKETKTAPGDTGPGPQLSFDTSTFVPITICIEYEMKDIRDGLQTIGFTEGDTRYPHAYTHVTSYSTPDCSLFPCLDDVAFRSTWEISIRCAKTVGEALRLTQPSSMSVNHQLPDAADGDCRYQDARTYAHLTPEDRLLELIVVCSGDLTDEINDANDSSKKTTSFTCSTPVSAQHMKFAIGPFERVSLLQFRDGEVDDRSNKSATPVYGFCLPGRRKELMNTCLPLAKALDFLGATFGSYPFTSYKLCFIDDCQEDIMHSASLSICSNRILFPEDILEPINRVTRQLVHALATQWVGIDIIAKTMEDEWVIVGMALYITDIFMRRLCGKNEYRFNQKKAADKVVELDVDRPALVDLGPLLRLDASQVYFMQLKAPLVLFILDQRMMKSGGTSGLQRIISKIFLNARVGDIPGNALDTAYFVRICERFCHTKLDSFFSQWVEGAGCPKFQIQQRFNKKKLVVEMSIHQVQDKSNLKEKDLEGDTFMRDIKEDQAGVTTDNAQSCFTGPITIRIHEADGTPYEHIVEIREPMQRFEIPYNTKYKRLKRGRKTRDKSSATLAADTVAEGTDDVLLYSLGDTLQSEDDIKAWRLAEWEAAEEDKMSQESYEWIRMDADFEWICKMQLQMPGYMWVSQLQQDRDVVAQLESVQYLNWQNANPLISTFLVRTLMDQRYFHGIRTAAAHGLAKMATEQVNWVGLHQLEKAFSAMFCYEDSTMPRPNNFSDRATYIIQCAIPEAISWIRATDGQASMRLQKWLFEKLRYNDNSNNEFSDCHYISILMKALASTMSLKAPIHQIDHDDFENDESHDIRFKESCLEEIDRHRRIDEWIPSHANIVSRTALECKKIFNRTGILPIRASEFLQYTSDGTSDLLRICAFSNLMKLGFAKNRAVMKWFLFVLGRDPSPFLREQLLHILGTTLGAYAIGEFIKPVVQTEMKQNGLIIEQESSTEVRKSELARRQTLTGAIEALKEEMASDKILQEGLWTAITSPIISLGQMWQLLEICDKLYIPQTSIVIALRLPRYWKCTKLGKGKVVFTETDRVRSKPLPRKPVKLKLSTGGGISAGIFKAPTTATPTASATPSYPFLKRDVSTNIGSDTGIKTPTVSTPIGRTFLKPPKPPQSSLPKLGPSPSAENGLPSPATPVNGVKPKLKIKFKVGGGTSSGAGSPS